MFEQLRALTQIQAVSGEEKYIFAYLKDQLNKRKITYKQLPHGDIVVGSKKPRLLLTAHVDEVGFVMTDIKANGAVSIKDIGWVYPWLFPGREIQTRTKSGEILKGVAIYDKAFDKEVMSWKKIKLDFGYTGAALKKMGISIGTFGTYLKHYWETPDTIFATALDNRLGVYLLLRLLDECPDILQQGISIAFTSNEEMDNAGAKKTVPWVSPEFLCVVDIMPHSLLEKPAQVNLARGPYILEKTPDYELPLEWKKILHNTKYVPIRGKSDYLKNSEPKIFQRLGYRNAINLLCITANYHHGTYSCAKTAMNETFEAIKKITQHFSK